MTTATKPIIEIMYLDKETLHTKTYTEAQRAAAASDWQMICKKKPDAKKIVRGLNRNGKYTESGDKDYDWDGTTSITVDIDYGYGKIFTYLSHKYRNGIITVTTRSGKEMDVRVVRCVRRTMDDIMDEMLAKPDFDRLYFIEEIMKERC